MSNSSAPVHIAFVSMLLVACGAGQMNAAAREWSVESGARSAFLFAYEIDRGRQSDFVVAYQDHLNWHIEHRDQLAWYGWFIANGPRVGMFVDGTFGITLEDYDGRPALADDARHFAETVAPHATARMFTQLALWPEVSTTFMLERWTPTRLLDVWTVEVEPASQVSFERSLERAVSHGKREEARLPWTIYRGVSGFERPTYVIMAPRENYAAAPGDRSSLAKIAALALGIDSAELTDLNDKVIGLSSEVWTYRPDLSLFPGNAPQID